MLEGREGREAGVIVRARVRMVRGDLGAGQASEEVGKLNEVWEKECRAVQVGRAEQEGGTGRVKVDAADCASLPGKDQKTCDCSEPENHPFQVHLARHRTKEQELG